MKANAQENYEKGERFPDAAYLAAVAAHGANVLYVVTGERKAVGECQLLNDEVDLVMQYRQLPEADRAGAAKMVTALAEMARRSEVKK